MIEPHEPIVIEREDPYFIVILNADRRWKVTRQVNYSSEYSEHVVARHRDRQLWCDCRGYQKNHKCRHVDMVRSLCLSPKGDT